MLFGADRDLALETTGSVEIHVPQRNNCVFTVGRDVHVRFTHSIISADDPKCNDGSVCLLISGRVTDIVEQEGSPEPLEWDA